jgi:hypothetical protein
VRKNCGSLGEGLVRGSFTANFLGPWARSTTESRKGEGATVGNSRRRSSGKETEAGREAAAEQGQVKGQQGKEAAVEHQQQRNSSSSRGEKQRCSGAERKDQEKRPAVGVER